MHRRLVPGAIVLTAALAIAACQSVVAPAPGKLRPWTTELRAAQPNDAFAAVYKHCRVSLIFVGAKHETHTDSLMFRLIDEAYTSFNVDTVIVEGPSYSHGANDGDLMSWVERQHEVNGFLEGGEAVVAIRGARARGADVWGGEPDDAYARRRLLSQGFSLQDPLGFYTLRSVPQWIRQQKITGPSDPRVEAYIESELDHNRERLDVPATVLPDHEAWTQWYADTNDKVFGATFELEETGPLADGRYGSNKIAEAISRARSEFLLVARNLS